MKVLGIVEFKRGEFLLNGPLPEPPEGYEWRGIVTEYRQHQDFRGLLQMDASVRFVLDRKRKRRAKA